MSEKIRNIFVEGAISAEFIGNSIAKHQSKTAIGAHQIFLGQVRADEVGGKQVQCIQYTAYEEMANSLAHEIKESAFGKFDLSCLHMHHSLGEVKAGEICLFVFCSSPHRAASFDACRFLVEEIKAKLPIFGKEIFEDASHQWKENK